MIVFCLLAVFYLRTEFGTGIDTALIESPVYSFKSRVCLSFYYMISSPTIILNVLSIQASKFVLLANFTYSDQVNLTSWNKAFIMLQDGVVQVRLRAEKFGITKTSQFVMVDRIRLNAREACHPPGE
jgi:FtsH-binding integral membrane protein